MNNADKTRTLAERAELLALELIDALPNPDTRQRKALELIVDAGQYLYAASINLKPHGEPDVIDGPEVQPDEGEAGCAGRQSKSRETNPTK